MTFDLLLSILYPLVIPVMQIRHASSSARVKWSCIPRYRVVWAPLGFVMGMAFWYIFHDVYSTEIIDIEQVLA